MMISPVDGKPVLDLIEGLGLDYTLHTHPAVYTVDQAKEHREGMENVTHAKNLFLKDSRTSQYYLLTTGAHQQFRLKQIRKLIGAKKLSFASEEDLDTILELEAGSVSPFGLLNDTDNQVIFVVTRKIWDADTVAFHPNINTQTVVMSAEGFHQVIAKLGYKPQIIGIDDLHDT